MPSSSQNKSVRFAQIHNDSNELKAEKSDESDDDSTNMIGSKRRQDDIDDIDSVDNWIDDEDREDGLPSAKELLSAKRARREKREVRGTVAYSNELDFETTNIDADTSLQSEGIAIEPFHMRRERTDGSGYFEGDTYIFRKRNDSEEPDAWLESLNKSYDQTAQTTTTPPTQREQKRKKLPTSKDFANCTEAELHSKVASLIGEHETIMQALVRYGNLLKRKTLRGKRQERNGVKHPNDGSVEKLDTQKSEAFQNDPYAKAQTAFYDLTECANILLMRGDGDIYQKKRKDLKEKSLGEETINSSATSKEKVESSCRKSGVHWEYRGNQDGKVHGPYSGEQMLSWIKAGYFVGSQAVQVRSVSEQPTSEVDDMLSDLMNDDDDAQSAAVNRGQWISSNDADFSL